MCLFFESALKLPWIGQGITEISARNKTKNLHFDSHHSCNNRMSTRSPNLCSSAGSLACCDVTHTENNPLHQQNGLLNKTIEKSPDGNETGLRLRFSFPFLGYLPSLIWIETSLSLWPPHVFPCARSHRRRGTSLRTSGPAGAAETRIDKQVDANVALDQGCPKFSSPLGCENNHLVHLARGNTPLIRSNVLNLF